ncbi:MAG: hypothetical protein AAB738_00470 [Patescibacteria group bacterium]
MKVGVLVHGRHLQSIDWDQIIWGKSPVKLGSLPMLVFIVLNRGVEGIEKIIFGSGASEKDGLKESQHMLLYFKSMAHRLSEFDQIINHPNFELSHRQTFFNDLFSKIECDTVSQNTSEEIAIAADKFTKLNIKEVIQIANASHAPRCARDSAVLREKNIIPFSQTWSVVSDMMIYPGTTAEEVVVIEPPHRGDDPLIEKLIQPYKVFSDFCKIKDTKTKVAVLSAFSEVIKKIADK